MSAFNVFDRAGFTNQSVRECAMIFGQHLEGTMSYLRSELSVDVTRMPRGFYERQVSSLKAAVDKLSEMHTSVHLRYTEYLASQNEKVEDLLGPEEVMEGYEGHYETMNQCRGTIDYQIRECKNKIQEAVDFNMLTTDLYDGYKSLMITLFEGLSVELGSYFGAIIRFHARGNKRLEVAQHERMERMFAVQAGKLEDFVAPFESDDELPTHVALLNDKAQELDQLRKEVLVRRKDDIMIINLEEYEGQIQKQKLEILTLLKQMKHIQERWAGAINAHCKSLHMIAWKRYRHQVTCEAVGLNDSDELKNIKLLSLSDSIKSRIDRLADRISCVLSRCRRLLKENWQMLRVIQLKKIQQLTLKMERLNI